MVEEVLTLVKVPISEIEEWMRTKHALPKVLTDFRIEENNLILYFSDEMPTQKESRPTVASDLH